MTPSRQRVRFALLLVALFEAGYTPVHGSLTGNAAERGLPIFELPRVERAFVDGQVSAFAQGEGGVVFVGSNRLAVFDGAQWRRIEVPGTPRILALAASPDGRRIWVGAFGTLGYVERSPQGEWSFVSLKERMTADSGLGVVNHHYVFPTPRGAFFVSYSRVFRWDGARMTSWHLPSPLRVFGFTDGKRPLVYQSGVGLLTIEDAGPQLWLPESSMPTPSPMVAMAVLRDGTPIGVFDEGVFRWRDGRWFRLDGVSDFLKGKRPRHAIALSDDTLVIGTLGNGLVFANADGKVQTIIGGERGLPGDHITGLWLDPTGQLWIGLVTGFARLAGGSHASVFDQRSRLFTMGSNKMRFVLSYDGRPHVVGPGNVYSLMPASEVEPAHFSRPNFFWTGLRAGTVFDDRIWLADPGGLWRLSKDLGTREKMFTGNLFLLLAPRAMPGHLLCFGGNACRAWLREAGASNPVDLGQTYKGAPISAIEGSDGAVWLSTRDGNVRRFSWDAGNRSLKLISHFSPGRGLPEGVISPELTLVNGAVLAFTDAGILAFDPVANAFLPASGLGGLIGIAAATAGANGYWIVQAKTLQEPGVQALIKVTAPVAPGRPFSYETMLAPGLDQIGEASSVGVTNSDGGEALWIGAENGVVRLETSALRSANPPPELIWQRVQTDTEGLAALAAGSPASFKVGVRRVEFSFAPRGGAAFAAGPLLYETRLEGVEEQWSPPQPMGMREFARLAPGRYTFAARAIDRFGRIGRSMEYRFAIEAPWYRQAWFPFVWLLPAALVFWGMYRRRLSQQAARMNLRLELQATERKRIARELHDSLLQGFIGVGLKLDAIATNLPESLASVRDQLRKILDQSDQYLTEARRSVLELRSTSLEKSEDLSEALSLESERLTEGTEIQLSYSVDGKRRKLAPHIESNLLRIGEEAVSNAVRHAHPAQVEVKLSFGAKEVSLQIRDNGSGFEPRGAVAVKVGHFGLVGMQERAEAMGGRFSVKSEAGQGTEIIVTVPAG